MTLVVKNLPVNTGDEKYIIRIMRVRPWRNLNMEPREKDGH